MLNAMLTFAYVGVAVPGSVPVAGLWAIVDDYAIFSIALLPMLWLLFPDGKPPTSRWRRVGPGVLRRARDGRGRLGPDARTAEQPRRLRGRLPEPGRPVVGRRWGRHRDGGRDGRRPRDHRRERVRDAATLPSRRGRGASATPVAALRHLDRRRPLPGRLPREHRVRPDPRRGQRIGRRLVRDPLRAARTDPRARVAGGLPGRDLSVRVVGPRSRDPQDADRRGGRYHADGDRTGAAPLDPRDDAGDRRGNARRGSGGPRRRRALARAAVRARSGGGPAASPTVWSTVVGRRRTRSSRASATG